MTLLLTPCPHCGDNFMMLDTENKIGDCILCHKGYRFTDKEIDEAESRRDGLTERYLGPIQQAFNNNDFETVTQLCEEVGRQGLSSWYIWTVAGICDARKGSGHTAMESFSLATMFLDEESFDEFYEMVMDAVLDMIVDDCNQQREFSISLSDLSNLAFSMEERFHEIMYIGLPQDMFTRLGMLVDEIQSPRSFADLLNFMTFLIVGFTSENVYLPDHIEAFEAMSASAESISNYGMEMGGRAWDDIAARASIFIECMSVLKNEEERILEDTDEDGLTRISKYWFTSDTDELVKSAETMLNCCLKYIDSAGRNKGMGKKMNLAIKDYVELLTIGKDIETDSPIPESDEEEWSDDISGEGNEDRFQPMTDVELPQNLESLREIGRKALADMDIPLMNDVSRAMTEMDDIDWFGWTLAGVVDSSRGDVIYAMEDFDNAWYSVRSADETYLRDIMTESLSKAISVSQDVMIAFEIHGLMGIAYGIDSKIGDEKGLASGIIDGLFKDAPLDSSENRFITYVVLNGMVNAALQTYPQLRIQRDYASKALKVLGRVRESLDPQDDDDAELLPDVDMMINYTEHLVKSLEEAVSSNNDERLMRLAHEWKDKDAYHEMVNSLRNNISMATRFKPNCKEAVDNRRNIDRYIKKYLAGPQKT